MGLLNSILGGIVGNALGRSGATSGMQGYGRGSARSRILMALLPVVLSMLANRRGAAPGARHPIRPASCDDHGGAGPNHAAGRQRGLGR